MHGGFAIKKESIQEMLKILKSSKVALTTQEILQKVRDKCPDASMSVLVTLMDSDIIIGKWTVGKGYLWTLPNSDNTNKLFENGGILPRKAVAKRR